MSKQGYLSPEEVGQRFRASKWTVRRWIEAGKLPAVRIGRRWLVRADLVERMQAVGLDPAQEPRYVVSRGPAPVYREFGEIPNERELDQMATVIVEVLYSGGWSRDHDVQRKEAVSKIILGDDKPPVDFWRLLTQGIRILSSKKQDAD